MKAMMMGGPRNGEIYDIVGTEMVVSFAEKPSIPPAVIASDAASTPTSKSPITIHVYERAVVFSNDRALFRYAGLRG